MGHEEHHPLEHQLAALETARHTLWGVAHQGGSDDRTTQVILAHATRGVRLADGIAHLVRLYLMRESAVLLRALVETTLSAAYLCAEAGDAERRAQRFVDWAAVKQASWLPVLGRLGWVDVAAVVSDERKKELCRLEADFRQKYARSDKDKKWKENWIGIGWDKAAKAVGLTDLYETAYRDASQYVHVTPHAISGIQGRADTSIIMLLDDRDSEHHHIGRTSCLVAGICVGTLAEALARTTDTTFDFQASVEALREAAKR